MKVAGIPSSGPRRHRGDIMSAEKRSTLMSKIKGKGTGPEQKVAFALSALALKWEGHASDLPGRLDFVFREEKVAVFVDGDFRHSWRFPVWRHKLSEKWEAKIDGNRRRDARNHQRLRRLGWRIVRLWEHQVTADVAACVARVVDLLDQRTGN
jgi:DNA mismatch endonuclease (patch repair protein)